MKTFKQFILEAKQPPAGVGPRDKTLGARLRDPKHTVGSAIRDTVKSALHPGRVAGKLFGPTIGSMIGKATGASQQTMNTIKYGPDDR